jgi:hypothetical protein
MPKRTSLLYRLRLLGAMLLVAVFGALAFAGTALAQDPNLAGDDPPGGIFSTIFQSDNELLFTLIAPGFLVYILGVLLQPQWSPKLKQAITYAVCAAAALGFLVLTNSAALSWDGLPRLFVLVAAMARLYFQMYLSPIRDVEQSVNGGSAGKG